MNDLFSSIIFQEFFLSALVVTVNIYQLSTKEEKDMEFLMVLLYLVCVLLDFLMYCWFGNEILLEVKQSLTKQRYTLSVL